MTTSSIAPLKASASIEITPTLLSKKPELLEVIPAGTEVFVTHLPGTAYETTADCAKALNKAGCIAVPHLAARSVRDLAALEHNLQLIADCERVLFLGGSLDKPIGDFHEASQLMPHARGRFSHAYIAGHPENAPGMPAELCDDAMRRKLAIAAEIDLPVTVVSQFAFEAAAYIQWLERIAPIVGESQTVVRVGVAGPATLKQLIHYATLCGVGNSIRFLKRQAMKITGLLSNQSADPMLEELLAQTTLATELHVFPLGGFTKSLDWLKN